MAMHETTNCKLVEWLTIIYDGEALDVNVGLFITSAGESSTNMTAVGANNPREP